LSVQRTSRADPRSVQKKGVLSLPDIQMAPQELTQQLVYVRQSAMKKPRTWPSPSSSLPLSSELHVQYGVWERGVSQLCVGRARKNTERPGGFDISSDSGRDCRDFLYCNFGERNRKGRHFMPNSYSQYQLIREDCLQPFELSCTRNLSWNCVRLQSNLGGGHDGSIYDVL
jgi:hypothetical protein